MRPLVNIKLFVLVLTCLISNSMSYGQIRKIADLDLNPGGVIYDVADVPVIDCYVVVGDFNTIGTGLEEVDVTNIAFIDKSDFSINTDYTGSAMFGSIDYPIYSVETYNTFVLGGPPSWNVTTTNNLYIGGKFTTINGDPHSKLARIVFTQIDSNPVISTVDGWDPEIDFWDATHYINDMTITNDTLVIAGDFLDMGGIHVRQGLAAYSVPGNTLLTTYLDNPPGYAYGYNSVNFLNGELLATANNLTDGKFAKVMPDGQWDNSVNYIPVSSVSDNYYDFRMLNDSLILLNHGWKFSYAASSIEYNIFNINNGINYSQQPDPYIPTVTAANQSAIYKHYLYTGTSNSTFTPYLSSIDINELGTIGWSGGSTTPATVLWDGQVNTPFNEQQRQQLFVEDNYLFTSASNMTSAGGSGAVGFAVYCLEPEDPQDFNIFDLTICEGNVRTYSIPTVPYAEGFRWTYSGTGAKMIMTGSGNSHQPFTDTIVTGVGAKSIEVKFEQGTTGGILTVYPYSTCNTTNDYLYAAPKSIVLTAAPIPNLTLVEDTMSFTCVQDSFYLIAQSTDAGATFEWYHEAFLQVSEDSLYLDVGTGPSEASYFLATVEEPINGCQLTDSVFVYYDTIPDSVLVSNIIATPPVFDCNTSSLSLDYPITGASVGWDLLSTASPPYANSYTIYDSNDSLNLWVYVTYNDNGCTAKNEFVIPHNDTIIGGTLTGYPNFGAIPIDSVNCFNPTLSLECDTINGFGYNGNAEWIIGGAPSGNTLNLTEADTVGVNGFGTNTYQFVTSNTDNGCTDTLDVTVKFDFEIPFVATYNGANTINCSASSLELAHDLNGGADVIEGWLDGVGVQTLEDTLIVTTLGEYYYEVESVINGCTNADTVTVTQTTELLLDLPTDTLVCPGQTVAVIALPINNVEATTYIWSTGDNTQGINVTGGVDTQVSVIAETASGCFGYDTLDILVNAPITADFIVSSACTDGAIQVSNVAGGAGSYQYSLDQINWQTTTVFTNLNFGTHTIYIQDALGCVYSFSETISDNSSGLDVNFLVSTYNGQGDTLAIVNISDFTGFDSIVWVLPDTAEIYSVDDSMVVLSIQTGGWYDVTLIGYQDTCGYSFTKPVFFGDLSPDYNVNYDSLGIQSTSIYPNPTSGTFAVDVVFGIEQNYSIVVTNMNGQPLAGMSVTGIGTSVSESFNFPFGSPTGPYVIHIIADFDAVQKTIILN